ncbi:hypothetical protein PAXINDRAFT_100211 [Paxillus involutus ATCC 200175]|uniref:Uncharacterized protein n=1 Tax=Paxillus involutus ATCC 200175 TaxID=664439 RepID=A0A0C9U4X0_PAXIN|nr:hypothetical protein PAXINDRAFT_100211 [Paxillus involutus ATCC 200175]
MIPKFTNPHSLSLGFETTTRAEHVEQTGIAASVARDENTDSLKRALDDLLRDTWVDGPGSCSRIKKRRRTEANHEHEDDKLVFRLVSSMKHPQCISLEPKPPPPPKTKEPDCEDSAAQAEERMKRARSVAIEFDRQWNVYPPHGARKVAIVEAKVKIRNLAQVRHLRHTSPGQAALSYLFNQSSTATKQRGRNIESGRKKGHHLLTGDRRLLCEESVWVML